MSKKCSDNLRQASQMALPQGFEVVLVDMYGNLHIKYTVKIDQYKYTVGRVMPLGAAEGYLSRRFREMMAIAMKNHIERVIGDG